MKSHLKLASVLIVSFFLMENALGASVSPLPPGAQNEAANSCRDIYRHLARLNECPPDTECVEVDGLIVDRIRIEEDSRCRIRLGEVGEEGEFIGTFSNLTAVNQIGEDYSFYYVIHDEEAFLSFDHYELELISGEVLRVVFTNVRDRASPARMAGVGVHMSEEAKRVFEEVGARVGPGEDKPFSRLKISKETLEHLHVVLNQAKAEAGQDPGDADIPLVDANPVQSNGCSLMANAAGQAGNSIAILFGFLGIMLTGLRSRVNRSKVRQPH